MSISGEVRTASGCSQQVDCSRHSVGARIGILPTARPVAAGSRRAEGMGVAAADHPSTGRQEPLSFGKQLRRLRQRAGLTQEVLAERAGVSVATIGALEEGQRRRSYPNTAAALAEALGLSGDERAWLLQAASGNDAPRRAAESGWPHTEA